MTPPDLQQLKCLFEEQLSQSLERKADGFASIRLNQAMKYALLSPGKRLRPLLVLSSALMGSQGLDAHFAIRMAMPAALAVEYLHTYSLIHDDLPAMDDDDFRRGRLSVHRRFDEAVAILTGDALLADAFFFAAKSRYQAAKICQELSLTAGSSGLAAGQSEDLNPKNQTACSTVWLAINQAKTARLFEACSSIGALSVDADKQQTAVLRNIGRAFGVAYQIKDDLEDQAGIVGRESIDTLMALCTTELKRARELSAPMPHNQNLLALLHLIFANWS